MEWAAQGRGGMTVPKSVQQMTGDGTEWFSSVGGDQLKVGLADLGALFQPKWFYFP